MPKSNNASSLADYRPISCCNVLYKLVTKIPSNRLMFIIEALISANQNAFLKGRQISDCTLLAHELIRDFKKKIAKRACLKIDLQKAFDSVDREFIYYLMHCMGFPFKWIGWITDLVLLSQSCLIDQLMDLHQQ